MDSIEATISYVSLRSNLVNLPSDLVSLLYSANINVQAVVIELSWKPKKKPIQYAYAGWSGMTSAASIKPVIEIDPIFANSFELNDNEKVTINLQFNAPVAHKIYLEPVSSSDWELVEIHSQFLEDRLLNQTRAVKLDQILVVYPSNTVIANLKVTKIEPLPKNTTKFAKISPNCEVIVAPKVRATKTSASSRKTRSIASSKRSSEASPKVLLRNICLPHASFKGVAVNEYAFEVYVNLLEIKDQLPESSYVSISVLPNEKIEEDQARKSTQLKTTAGGKQQELNGKIKNVVAKIVHFADAPPNYIGLLKILTQSLGIHNSNGNMIVLQSALNPLSRKPTSLLIHPFTTKTPERNTTKEKVLGMGNKRDLGRYDDLLSKEDTTALLAIKKSLADCLFFNNNAITNFVNLPIVENYLPEGGALEFKSSDGWYISETIDEINFEISTPILKKTSEIERILLDKIEDTGISTTEEANGSTDSDDEDVNIELIGYENLKTQITTTVQKAINGVLIHGPSGSGKSLLIKSLIQDLYPKSLHKIILIDLENHLNEVGNFEAIKKTFSKLFLQLIRYEKVILIIENFHLVCYQESEQIFNDGNSVTNNFTEFFISNYFKLFNESGADEYDVRLILTSNTKDNLNKLLLSNPLLVNHYFKINVPDKTQRADIIKYYLEKKNLQFEDPSGVELNDLLNETEGYLPIDLKVLIERAYHEVLFDYLNRKEGVLKSQSQKQDTKQPHTIVFPHFEKALKDFTPSGLRNIKLQQSKVKWDDIGGLKKAKEILLETLEWPTKYAPIFANCPLRLRSGILLYGYPGCGKTLLASAVSSQCGLNFISVKGPEILNKYIGASEQSVRELFERASAARPCILFFDEFDSIAPKRGHDSTGVTDRVVNQMLTQMDGAEGLDGVYVLAATSRPDLIDSALLRPGRLDKSVICDIPDLENRMDIIQTVTKKMSLGAHINLKYIAEQTEGFSGADIQALCYNAYLNAVHRKLQNDTLEEEKVSNSNSKTQDHNAKEFFQFSLNSENNIKNLSIQEKAQLHKKIHALMNNDKTRNSISDDDSSDDSNKKEKKFSVIIELEDFEKVVKESNPSISSTEKAKLQKIYNEFISDRDGNMPDGSASNKIGGRTSLM